MGIFIRLLNLTAKKKNHKMSVSANSEFILATN